jgi:hypothetical protein
MLSASAMILFILGYLLCQCQRCSSLWDMDLLMSRILVVMGYAAPLVPRILFILGHYILPVPRILLILRCLIPPVARILFILGYVTPPIPKIWLTLGYSAMPVFKDILHCRKCYSAVQTILITLGCANRQCNVIVHSVIFTLPVPKM